MTLEVFRRRVAYFEEVVEILENLAATPLEVFTANPEKYGSAERFLQIAIEVLDDLGAHVIAQLDGSKVERYRDIPDALLRSGKLSEKDALLWREIIGFRNVIVHGYLEVDRTIVYGILINHLQDLRRILSVLQSMIELP